MNDREAWKSAIVTVGDGGRGFVVERMHRHARLVITAAHCLPHLPPAHAASYVHERTYPALLAPLGAAPTIAAECLFVDPVADVAVLSEPDNQTFDDPWDDYLALVDAASVVRVGIVSPSPAAAWLLTIDGAWQSCTVRPSSPVGPARALTLIDAGTGNAPGCSGSPILDEQGRALGLVVVGGGDGAGQPVLASTLPLWLLSELRVDVGKARAACRAYIGVIRGAMQGMHARADVTFCESCREAAATIERASSGALKFKCHACGHWWSRSATRG